MLRLAVASLVYFAMVFGTGFVLGPIRVLYLVPRLGERYAELLEMPVMLLVIVTSARWLVRHFAVGVVRAAVVGATSLVLLLAAEFGFVLALRGMTIADYLATRDPVSGTVYYLALVVFGVMPAWFARRSPLPGGIDGN